MADVSDSREHPVLGSAQLLVELESALGGEKTVTAQASSSSLGLGIEVIDETALLDSVAKKNGGSRRTKNNNNGHNHKKSKPSNKIGNKKYSRKELESLRFVNMARQRKFWKAIHAAFQTTVAMEYDALASSPLPHNKPILSKSFSLFSPRNRIFLFFFTCNCHSCSLCWTNIICSFWYLMLFFLCIEHWGWLWYKMLFSAK